MFRLRGLGFGGFGFREFRMFRPQGLGVWGLPEFLGFGVWGLGFREFRVFRLRGFGFWI